MANRMLVEALWMSAAMGTLPDALRVLWCVLLQMTDSAGNGPADPAIIKWRGYAYRDDVTMPDIAQLLSKLEEAGKIMRYQVDGQWYYHHTDFETTQKLRHPQCIYPLPDGTPADVANRELRAALKLKKKKEEEDEEEVDGEAKRKAVGSTAKRAFSPPSVDEINVYCNCEGISIDAQRFVDYYTSNGWRVGPNPMTDWRAAARRWSERDTHRKKGTEWRFEDID